MYSLKTVPCVKVTSQNIDILWNDIIESLKNCHVVALDLELTGLGPRNKLNAKLVDDRYHALSDTAKTRSIVSLGLSLFTYVDDDTSQDSVQDNHTEIENEINSSSDKLDDEACDLSNKNVNPNNWYFTSQIYNIICICDDDYVVEPETLRFLVSHGFDFNCQCSIGLPYHRGNDNDYEDKTKPSLRNLISLIIAQKLPLVVHNGFIDLIFLYQNFYCDLPSDMQVFLSDLSEMFPSGIYDTKYIADFHARLSRSYLEYLFYERQRFNLDCITRKLNCIFINFPHLNEKISDIECKDLSTKFFSNVKDEIICLDYAYHGWCKNNNSCTKSHNIDYILDTKNKKNKRLKKRIRAIKEFQDFFINNGDVNDYKSNQSCHRAGYDAFMTGYCFLMFIANFAKNKPDINGPMNSKKLGINNFKNNIYLTGKDQPLKVIASSFVKPSISHKNKLERLKT